MFTQYLQSIAYVTVYPIVSLVLFLAVFVGAVVWALRADNEYIRSMERLPLDSDESVTPMNLTPMKGPVR